MDLISINLAFFGTLAETIAVYITHVYTFKVPFYSSDFAGSDPPHFFDVNLQNAKATTLASRK